MTGRRDESPRDAIEAAADPWDDPVALSPRCAAGQCRVCTGTLLDPDGFPQDCQCSHHALEAVAVQIHATGILSMASIRAQLETEFDLQPGSLDA